MTDNSTDNSGSIQIPKDEVERKIFETLRAAAFIFQNEKHGRFQGSILALRAVAYFIRQRNGPAELAGPFLQIAEAFKDLEKGGKPKLFSKKSVPDKERERSPERKHMQMLAAAMLEVLVERGEERGITADKIARSIIKWPGMSKKMSGRTVIAWRDQWRRKTEQERKCFDIVVERMLSTPKPQQTVIELLGNGPPGMWLS